MSIFFYLILGLIGGMVSGGFGIGGGTIIVPALVYFWGLTQHEAQGTALTVMVLPVFVFAVWRYYQAGNVNVLMAMSIAIGFALGAFLGAHLVQGVADTHLRRAFGIFLMLIGLRMALLK